MPATISLYDAGAAEARTSTDPNSGTLITSIPYTYTASRFLYVPNGYVTYENYHPVSFTWTGFPAIAPTAGAVGTSYVYGEFDDGTDTPARSFQAWPVQPSNPMPQLGAVAPITTDFSQTLRLPAPTLSDPGQWPLVITVTDDGGYGTLSGPFLGGPTGATTLSFRTSDFNAVPQALAFLQGLTYSPASLPSGFPGHDSVTITVSALVNGQAPYTARRPST